MWSTSCAAEVGRVAEDAGRGELADEAVRRIVRAAAVGRLEGVAGRREVGGHRVPCDVDVAERVERDRAGRLRRVVLGAAAAEIRREEDGRAGRIELGDERVGGGGRADLGRLMRVRRREVRRRGDAGQVDVAVRVDGDGAYLIVVVAAEVRRVGEDRVDDQRLLAIVVTERDGHLLAAEQAVVGARRRAARRRRSGRPRGDAGGSSRSPTWRSRSPVASTVAPSTPSNVTTIWPGSAPGATRKSYSSWRSRP